MKHQPLPHLLPPSPCAACTCELHLGEGLQAQHRVTAHVQQPAQMVGYTRRHGGVRLQAAASPVRLLQRGISSRRRGKRKQNQLQGSNRTLCRIRRYISHHDKRCKTKTKTMYVAPKLTMFLPLIAARSRRRLPNDACREMNSNGQGGGRRGCCCFCCVACASALDEDWEHAMPVTTRRKTDDGDAAAAVAADDDAEGCDGDDAAAADA